MASLAKLTDYYPQLSTDLPVVPLNNDVTLSTGEGMPTRITVRPEPRPEPEPAFNKFNTNLGNKLNDILNKLTGAKGKERYQLWPVDHEPDFGDNK